MEGFLDIAGQQRLSPHHDQRPPGAVTELVVLHGISLPAGEFGGPWIDALFMGRWAELQAHEQLRALVGLRVSAHFLIRRDGLVVQYVPLHLRAWHAGVSCWWGRTACNDFSVGIELEGCDQQAYADAQYEGLHTLLQAMHTVAPSLREVVRHSDIAPGRKTDPGPAFDTARLILPRGMQFAGLSEER